jgi:hypothetical protein
MDPTEQVAEPRNEIVENVCQIYSQSYILPLKLEANILTHTKKKKHKTSQFYLL